MDPQQQAMAAALMGGQNSVLPSSIAPMPQQQQFSPQALGYGGQQGMFGQPQMPQQMPYGAQAQMNMTPQNMQGMQS